MDALSYEAQSFLESPTRRFFMSYTLLMKLEVSLNTGMEKLQNLEAKIVFHQKLTGIQNLE